MSEQIVYVPPAGHYCGPNRWGIILDGSFDPVGTVRECAPCGKSWVAYRDERDPGYMGVKWKPEGWLARRRRLRVPSGLSRSGNQPSTERTTQ